MVRDKTGKEIDPTSIIILEEGDCTDDTGKVVGHWTHFVTKAWLLGNKAAIQADMTGPDQMGYRKHAAKVDPVFEEVP
jgi:hypothetical protein